MAASGVGSSIVQQQAGSNGCVATEANRAPAGPTITKRVRFAETVFSFSCEKDTREKIVPLPKGLPECSTPMCIAIRDRDILEVKRLVKEEGKAVASAADPRTGLTPLHLAVLCVRKVTTKFLLSKGQVDVNARDPSGRTALHIAAQTNEPNMVKILIGWEADLNARNGLGRTALHIAAHEGLLDIVECLVREKADIHQKDHESRTPLQLAWRAYRADVAEFLTRELALSETGLLDQISQLIEVNAESLEPPAAAVDVQVQPITYAPVAVYPPHWPVGGERCAAEMDPPAAFQTGALPALPPPIPEEVPCCDLSAAPRADAPSPPPIRKPTEEEFLLWTLLTGWPQLLKGAASGNMWAVAKLLKHWPLGVHADDADTGDTLTHVAAEQGHLAMVKLLVNAGARIDRVNFLNETPLLAAERARQEHERLGRVTQHAQVCAFLRSLQMQQAAGSPV